MQNEIDFSLYAKLVAEYTSQNLSHDRDITNAFAAVLNAIRDAYRDTEHQIAYDDGFPLHYLDIALLW